MIPKMKITGQAVYRGTSVLWGAGVSIMVTILLAMLTAWLITAEKLSEENMGYAVMGLLLIASYIGGYIGCRAAEGKQLIKALVTGAVYMGILLGTGILFFDGDLNAVGETLLLILCGNVLAAMWSSRSKTAFKKRKLKIPNR